MSLKTLSTLAAAVLLAAPAIAQDAPMPKEIDPATIATPDAPSPVPAKPIGAIVPQDEALSDREAVALQAI